MRSAGNFSPEWGYLAPVPSFMRTARVVLVATAVGATAGAGVVLSLADRPAADGVKTSIAAHAIVTSAQAAMTQAAMTQAATTQAASISVPSMPSSLPPAAPGNVTVVAPSPAPQIQADQSVPPQPSVAQPTVANQSAAIAPTQPSTGDASTAALGASAPNTASAPLAATALSPDAASADAAPATNDAPDATAVTPEQAPPPKKKHYASKNKPDPGFGSVIRHIFTAHAGPSYYPNRGL